MTLAAAIKGVKGVAFHMVRKLSEIVLVLLYVGEMSFSILSYQCLLPIRESTYGALSLDEFLSRPEHSRAPESKQSKAAGMLKWPALSPCTELVYFVYSCHSGSHSYPYLLVNFT